MRHSLKILQKGVRIWSPPYLHCIPPTRTSTPYGVFVSWRSLLIGIHFCMYEQYCRFGSLAGSRWSSFHCTFRIVPEDQFAAPPVEIRPGLAAVPAGVLYYSVLRRVRGTKINCLSVLRSANPYSPSQARQISMPPTPYSYLLRKSRSQAPSPSCQPLLVCPSSCVGLQGDA